MAKGRVESNAYRLSTGLMNSRVYRLHYREGALHHMDQDNLYLMGQVRGYRNKYCYETRKSRSLSTSYVLSRNKT